MSSSFSLRGSAVRSGTGRSGTIRKLGRYFQRVWQKLWIEGGFSPMQAKRHGDLSTMPAANFTSGRVPTMFEGHEDPAGQNKNPDEMGEFNEMEALLRASAN